MEYGISFKDDFERDHEDGLWEDQGCILGDECLHHDPEHTSDECFDLEEAQEHYKEGARTTEEYRLGVDKEKERINREFNRLTFNYSSRLKCSKDYDMLVEFVNDVRSAINPAETELKR